ncbi:lipoprotein [Rhodanobacter sp. L36]|uniref:LPS translocon maturation chaperone LptM n=1 Tax=Rhodanobacter sp. L36 TaxID=1747221 RepID=UPI00131DAADE|nr:lipoprotein [Rhodanobacter sp. L36]
MRRSNLLLSLCLVAATLAGCGQKGPLTMPPARPVSAKPAAAASVARPAEPVSPTTAPTTPTQTNIPDGQQY